MKDYLSTLQAIKTALISEFVTTMKLKKASTDSHENGYQNGKTIIPIKWAPYQYGPIKLAIRIENKNKRNEYFFRN